jgi:hypothetical protein
VIDALDPATVSVNRTDPIAVVGQNFAKEAIVMVGGSSAETTFENEKRLTFKLPSAIAAHAGTVDVVVRNASPQGASSTPKKLTIVP